MAMEDSRYRDSSQYRLWSFSPTQLADVREKTNTAARARIQERLLSNPPPATAPSSNNVSAPTSNANTPDPDGSGTPKPPATPEFLTPAEESLLVNFNTSELLRAAEVFEFSDNIKATGAIFFKRFYVTNSIMTYPPQEMMIVALFFGCKAEGAFPNINEFIKIFNKKSAEEILAGEFLLFQGLRFALEVKHPFRALRGAMMELRALGEFDPNHLTTVERKAREILQFSPLMTDAYFHYTPSQIMLAALSLADRGLAERLLQKTFHFVAPSSGADTPISGSATPAAEDQAALIGSQLRDKVLGAIEACRDMLSKELPERREHWTNKSFIKTQIGPVRRKLKKCCDPERWNLVELQRTRREQASKRAESDDEDGDGEKPVKMEDDGAIFGEPLSSRDPKRKKIKLEPGLQDPFGPAM
ncbi:cyclin-like protein [Cladorrhinum sp. PSN259]|nr:cyclin-like protein [Cladorrhinum sp. PSN259]